MAIVDTDGPPPGSFVRLDWTCGNCGTEYTLEAMVGGSELVELWRERRV